MELKKTEINDNNKNIEEEVTTNEIFSFNMYLITFLVIIYYSYCIFFPFGSYTLTVYMNNIVLIIIVTFFTIFLIYFLLSEYWSYEKTNQREDILFKPLKKSDMYVELNPNIESGILPDVGDLDFSIDFIENNFLS